MNLSVLGITGPIYLLIAAGYVLVRTGVLTQPDTRVLGRFVVYFCIPAQLLHTLMGLPIRQVLHWNYLLTYLGGSLLTLLSVTLFSRAVLKRPMSLAATLGLGASSANTAFVGFPIVLQLIGPSAGLALALVQLTENLVVIPLSLALSDLQGQPGSSRQIWRTTARSLVRNPMIVAIVSGLVLSLLAVPIPRMLDKAITLAAAAAPPTALVVIGGSLVGLRLDGLRSQLALVAVGKLLLHPLAVLACLLVVGALMSPVPAPLRGAAVLFAAMPMLSIYPVLAQRHGHERFCAAALLAVTLLSFFSVSALIALMPASWLASA
jgi:malonate transporter